MLNPPLIASTITIAAVGSWTFNDFPEYKEAFTYQNKDNFPWLLDHHGTNEKIKALMNQFNNYTVRLKNEELKTIKPEVLIMIGDDDDGMDLEEVARVEKNLPESDLWIVPNVAHGAHEGETKDEFIIKSRAFLSKD